MPYNPFDIIDTNTTEGVEIMTSEKKAEANRRNALKSTGPKTPRGRAPSARTPSSMGSSPKRPSWREKTRKP